MLKLVKWAGGGGAVVMSTGSGHRGGCGLLGGSHGAKPVKQVDHRRPYILARSSRGQMKMAGRLAEHKKDQAELLMKKSVFEPRAIETKRSCALQNRGMDSGARAPPGGGGGERGEGKAFKAKGRRGE